MSIYDRMMGLAEPAIPIHQFFAAMQEYMLDNMSGAEAVAAFALDAGEVTEAQALRTRILTESSSNANLQRRLKAIELENVLILARSGVAPYTTVDAVKTRLGVA